MRLLISKNGKIIPELFWKRVRKTKRCWIWIGAVKSKTDTACSYGKIRLNNKIQTTHRISWKINNGEIPKGMHVLHKCDNPPCVRPSHLFLGTNRDNIIDCYRKGRSNRAFGENVRTSSFSNKQVIDIKKRLSEGEKVHEIAKDLRKKYITIWMIASRRNWANVN